MHTNNIKECSVKQQIYAFAGTICAMLEFISFVMERIE
jgi:hypothetical protein